MAITKIHGIKSTVNKAVEYICDPAKTDEQIFVSSFACAPETAALDFKYTLDHAREQKHENQAFHLIQAFAPGEVSSEKAHAIGTELADQLLKGKYSYILTTHIDKGHIHNHLIFCSVDNINYSHYHDCRQSYRQIRKISDKLCAEHGLSVIDPSGEKGKTYKEWSADKNLESWKTQLRKDINQSIKHASNYEEFLAFMTANGYEIENAFPDTRTDKYIRFRPLGQIHYVSGSTRTLGKEYTRFQIQKRIANKHKTPAPSRSIRDLINIYSDPKYQENPGLQNWAKRQNLKTAAQTFNLMSDKGITSIDELDRKIASYKEQEQSLNSSIHSAEKQIIELAETIKYADQYIENKPYHDRYQKSHDPDRYLRNHESAILLFSSAEQILRQKGIDLITTNSNIIKKQYQALLADKQKLVLSLKDVKNELRTLEQIHQNISAYTDPPDHFPVDAVQKISKDL